MAPMATGKWSNIGHKRLASEDPSSTSTAAEAETESFDLPCKRTDSPLSLLSRSNSSKSTDGGYLLGSAGSSPLPFSTPRQNSLDMKLGFEDYPVPQIVVRDDDGLLERFPIRIRNTFLDIQTPNSAVELEERIVRSCPVSRLASCCSDCEDEDEFIPKPNGHFGDDFCDTSTEVWENEDICTDLEDARMPVQVPVSRVEAGWMPPVSPAVFRQVPLSPLSGGPSAPSPLAAAPFGALCVPPMAPPQLHASMMQVDTAQVIKCPQIRWMIHAFLGAASPSCAKDLLAQAASEPPPPSFSPGDAKAISEAQLPVAAPSLDGAEGRETASSPKNSKAVVARVAPPTTQAPTFSQEVSIPPPPQVPPSCGSSEGQLAQLPSVGSSAHGSGNCKPCAFLFKTMADGSIKGCESGGLCKFCHLCPPGEKKRRRKVMAQNPNELNA